MKDNPQVILQRGHAAQSLLGSDIFNGVCEDIIQANFGRWLVTNEREIREREEMHGLVRAIQALRAELTARVDAAAKQEADDRRAEKRKTEI